MRAAGELVAVAIRVACALADAAVRLARALADAAVRLAWRRRSHLLLGCVVGGLALSPAPTIAIAALACAVAAGAALAFGSRAALIAPALVLAAGAAGSARIAAIDRPAAATPPGTVIEATATLLERPRATRFGTSAPMAIETGSARGLHVLARVDVRDWPQRADPGLRVRIRGLVREPERSRGRSSFPSEGEYDIRPGSGSQPSESNAGEPGTPGYGPLPGTEAGDDFDYAAFLRSRGIGRELKVEWMRPAGRRGGLSGVVDRIRRRAEDAIAAGLRPERAALARGMVLGEDGDITDAVRDDFQRSGLAHLLAASGQNVMLLCALALPLLMLARTGPRARAFLLLGVVALYVPLAGAGASVERAGVMAATGLVALGAGRRSSAGYALLLAAAATLAMNPRATGDPGWQLSFAAVGGMLMLGPHLRRLMRGLPRPPAEALAATIAATLATAPLMAHQFGAVSLAALPANIVVLPVVAPIMWIGMTEAALGQLAALGGMPASGAGVLCQAAGHASGLGLRWVAGAARRFADPAWAQAPVHIGWPAVAVAYAVLLAAAFIAARIDAARNARIGARGGSRIARGAATLGAFATGVRVASGFADRWRALPARTRRAALVLAASLGLGLGAAWALPPPAPKHLTVDYLDIGQGDATLIRDPSGAAVLFDGGPPEARVDRILLRLGVRSLSMVIATHQSRDHHGGLAQVVRRFPVGLFLDGGDGTRDPTFLALEREVDRRGIRRITVRRGQVFRTGAMTIRILSPGPRPPGGPPADPNPRATVAVVSEHGFDLFLSADAETPALLPLALPRVEAIKVPHHGSADPGLPQLLDRLRPRVAAIEVGRGNDYGHPRPSTLNALRAAVPHVYRTDRDGTVELTVRDGGIDVRTHR